jgi:hypothetical protein
MSWLKLELINYDTSYINKSGFILGFNSKSIKDYNFNDIINVPLLIHKNYELYKIELKIYNNNLIVYLYVNYNKLLEIIKKNLIVPFRNELFEIIKLNSKRFKMNEKNFNEIQKYIFNPLKNSNNVEFYPALSNNIIKLNNIIIDVDKQQFHLGNKYKDYCFQELNTYLMIDIPNNLHNLIINYSYHNDKILIIYNSNKDLEFLKKSKIDPNYIDINLNNYNNITYNKILNTKTIFISTKLIRSKKYWKEYMNFHSIENLDYAHDNFRNCLNCYAKNNSVLYNVEFFKFDKIFFINFFNNSNIKHTLLNFFTNKLNFKKKYFIENSFNIDFNYNYYCSINKYIFKKEIINDIGLNLKFLIDNTVFYKNIPIPGINNYIKLKPKKYDNPYFKYNNLFLFEYILSPKNIKYSIKFSSNTSSKIHNCPITYENSLDNIFIETSCNHFFSFKGLVNHLSYSNKCPLCSKNISNTELNIFGKLDHIYKLLLGDINNFNNSYIIVDNNEDSAILNNRVQKLSKLLNKLNIRYLTCSDMIKDNKSIKKKNCFLFEHTCQSRFYKLKNRSYLNYYFNDLEYNQLQIIDIQ